MSEVKRKKTTECCYNLLGGKKQTSTGMQTPKSAHQFTRERALVYIGMMKFSSH